MSYSSRFLAGTYGSSLKSLSELQKSMQSGDFHREGSEIVYAGGKRMSLVEAKSHMENIENIGIISLNETNQAFRLTKSTMNEATKLMEEASRV